tara:strand:- start:15 stop:1586 length:1572 start_codon:yes stop_codon:yes gene_type:complete
MMMSELNFQDQAKGGNAQSGLVGTNDKQILMLLSEDLRKTYMRPLVDRLHELDVIAAIDELNYPEEKQKKFHWILTFPGDIPKGKTPDINSAKLIFRVLGIPDVQPEKINADSSEKLKKIVERFKEVQQTCQDREKNPAFVKLAITDAILRKKKEMMVQYEKLMGSLDKKIAEVEIPYYQGIGYILTEAIEKITGVAVLDKLMKGLIYVMIIDDLEKRTIDGLVKIDFSRKYLSYMPTSELSKKLKAFREENTEDFKDASVGDLIFHSPDFENVDIVFFNSWKFTEDSFPVRVALRKKTLISKKEERQVQQQDYNKSKIMNEEKSLEEVKNKLNQLMREINKIEKSHLEDEDEYQNLNNSRRRLLKDINRRELRLKELKRPVKDAGEEKIITFDLFEIFKSNQSFLHRMGDKAGSMGLASLFGKNVETEKRFSFNRLYEMANFSKDWIKASNQLKKISSESSRLAEQLDQFVEKHKLSASSVGTRSKEKLNYQPLLDEHILDRMELAVLSCEIVKLCEGKQTD